MVFFLLFLFLFYLLFTFMLNLYEKLNAPKLESVDPLFWVAIAWEGIVSIFVLILDTFGLFINYDFLFAKGNKRYPIILIPGYSANRGYFFPYAYFLNKAGFKVYTMPPVPFYCNIYYQSEILGRKVDQILEETGASKVILVGHSMGGLIARYYVQRFGGDSKTAKIITISTPHRGTKISVFGFGYSAKEMVPNSKFLKDINSDVSKYFKKVPLVSLGTTEDNLVVPYGNSFAKIGKKYKLNFLGHNAMMFSMKVFYILLEEAEKAEADAEE